MDFQLHGVNLDKLFVFLNRPHPSPALGHLERFQWERFFKNENRLKLLAIIRVGICFSNRGKREMQTMSLISGNAVKG